MTKTLGKLLGALRNEVAKEVDFEAQPEPFDWIEIGAVAWQVVNLEVVPIQSLGFVPTGVVNDEQSTFGVQRRESLLPRNRGNTGRHRYRLHQKSSCSIRHWPDTPPQ